MLRLARLAGDLLRRDHASSTGFSSYARGPAAGGGLGRDVDPRVMPDGVVPAIRPVRSVIRRLGGGKHAGAADAATWTASLARAGFIGARVISAGLASRLVLIIGADRRQPAGESTQRRTP